MVTPKKVQVQAAAMNTPTKSPHGHTVSSLMSPVDASKFTGRYETTVIKKDGTYSTVLRSLRNIPRDHELLLRGSLTPTPKKCAGTVEDIDNLCGALSSVVITPTKIGAKLGARSSTDSMVKVAADETKADVSVTIEDKEKAEDDKIPAKSTVQPVLRRTRRGGPAC